MRVDVDIWMLIGVDEHAVFGQTAFILGDDSVVGVVRAGAEVDPSGVSKVRPGVAGGIAGQRASGDLARAVEQGGEGPCQRPGNLRDPARDRSGVSIARAVQPQVPEVLEIVVGNQDRRLERGARAKTCRQRQCADQSELQSRHRSNPRLSGSRKPRQAPVQTCQTIGARPGAPCGKAAKRASDSPWRTATGDPIPYYHCGSSGRNCLARVSSSPRVFGPCGGVKRTGGPPPRNPRTWVRPTLEWGVSPWPPASARCATGTAAPPARPGRAGTGGR